MQATYCSRGALALIDVNRTEAIAPAWLPMRASPDAHFYVQGRKAREGALLALRDAGTGSGLG